MSPEFRIDLRDFPIDAETLRYLEFQPAAPTEQISWSTPTRASRASSTSPTRKADYSDTLELDLATSTEHRRPEAPPGQDRPDGTPSRPSSRRCRSGIPRPVTSSATCSTWPSTEFLPASDPPARGPRRRERQAQKGRSGPPSPRRRRLGRRAGPARGRSDDRARSQHG